MKNFAKIFVLTALFAVIVFPVAAGGSSEGSGASGSGDKRAALAGEWGKAKDTEGYQWFVFEEDGDTISLRSVSMMGQEEDYLKLTSYDGSTLNAVMDKYNYETSETSKVSLTFTVKISGDKLTVSGLTDNPDTLIYLSSYNGTYTKGE